MWSTDLHEGRTRDFLYNVLQGTSRIPPFQQQCPRCDQWTFHGPFRVSTLKLLVTVQYIIFLAGSYTSHSLPDFHFSLNSLSVFQVSSFSVSSSRSLLCVVCSAGFVTPFTFRHKDPPVHSSNMLSTTTYCLQCSRSLARKRNTMGFTNRPMSNHYALYAVSAHGSCSVVVSHCNLFVISDAF